MERVERGLLLVLATASISGFSIFINKFGVAGLDSSFFTTAKNVVVALLLITTILLLNEWKSIRTLTGKQWSLLALIGLVGGSTPFLLFFTGLKLTSSAQGSFIHKLMFLWVILLGLTWLKEKLDWKVVSGAILLVAGNLLLLRIKGFSLGKGDLLILAATLFWAAEITLSKRFLDEFKLKGRVVAFGRMGFGSFFLLLYLAATEKLAFFVETGWNGWLWIIVTAVLLYCYVFTFYEGLKTVPAGIAASILVLGSVVTTLLELAWTSTVAWPQLAGSALLVLGVALVADVRKIFVQRRKDV